MQTITGLFDNHADARRAVNALESEGIPSSDISIVGRGEENDSNASEGAAAGAGLGAVVGGAGGLLAGLGMMAIPGIGPVVAAGWLASTLAGAAAGAAAGGVAGGLIGALTDDGVSEEDAHVYAEGVRRGGTLVTARVEDNLAPAARVILSSDAAVDIARRREIYAGEGWTRFDESNPDYTDAEIAAERLRLRNLR
ncbi:general stress protein [Pseudaminobacter sp. NGMCC 1.201702]|uniref:general stress protein n=1 Tax=Pseudaminobacter sp. NGMCC 1.201702 TaxID=3391825 RepID=UPI0039EEF861